MEPMGRIRESSLRMITGFVVFKLPDRRNLSAPEFGTNRAAPWPYSGIAGFRTTCQNSIPWFFPV